MLDSEQDWRDQLLSDALVAERKEFRRNGYADCTLCGQRVRGFGPWCDLYQQGEIRCIGRRIGPQAPETPVG